MIHPERATAKLVREHLQALHIGSEVTRWFREKREPQVLPVTPERVLEALHQAGINPVLMGVHGINVYRDQARATQDVDVLVTKKDIRKAVRVLEETFPYLEVHENSAVARFLDPVSQKVVIDVMKPSSRSMQMVFRNTKPIGDKYRIPNLEMALISKYTAMTAPNRTAHKRQSDAGDFAAMVDHCNDQIDEKKLKHLAESLRRGAGQDIIRHVEDARAGRTLDIPRE